MPVINGVYLKDFTALPGAVADANIIPIAITGDNVAYRTTVAGIVTDARITAKLLTGLSVTGGAVVAADTILAAFGKVQNQINGKQGTITLTTTGTSGAATLVSNTLNIPNYADGGVLSLSAIGATANANAATITGTVLNLQPADASFGGVVTTGAQTIAGAKTFSVDLKVNGLNIGKGGGSLATNTSIGVDALTSNTTGLANTAIGKSALNANTDGNFNNAVGVGSLQYNTTGISNSALGYVSLSANISGSQNSAFGNTSLTANTTGGSNTALGYSALTDNISGSNNVGIGYNSGGTLTTGSNNTFIGANVVSSSSSLANNILIGNGSGAVKAQHDGTNWTLTGGTTITGVLTLNSTITNGTYTYTLPSATGTLALTSALTGYLPLTGGTLTGALSGTSASFSGNIVLSGSDSRFNGGNLVGRLILSNSNTTTYIELYGATHPTLPYIMSFVVNSASALSIASTGAATFSSSVTATGFFESSSVAGKDIMQTNPLTNLNLDVIQYTRKTDENKDVRYGYSAEQIHSLMPELTDKDVTAVKYLDVHTLLIAQLQQEIKELKAKLN